MPLPVTWVNLFTIRSDQTFLPADFCWVELIHVFWVTVVEMGLVCRWHVSLTTSIERRMPVTLL